MRVLSLIVLFVALSFATLSAVSPPTKPDAPKPPVVPADHAKAMAESRELFTKTVRKTLVDNCLKCHGQTKTRGGLDIATRELLLKGGDNGPSIVPGQSKQSRLYRLAAKLDEPHMPPKGHEALNKTQLSDLAKWIDLGAAYDRPLLDRADSTKPKVFTITDEDRGFWSFKRLQNVSVPVIAQPERANNAVDRFLLAKLDEKKLVPNRQADRRTLIRRVFFDVLGLPPTPEEVDLFVQDPRPEAYERLVDRVLASPAYGERWARHWLDLARFAESHGFEHDYDRPHAWPYRDFVTKGLNQDMGYDTFVKWQLAGDEFEPSNPLAVTATGFLGAGVHSTQITANTVEKERYDELDDIVRTMGTGMLGLTIGCARCHDHKYDPVPTKDYYRLLSTFTKTVRSDVDIDLDADQARQARTLHAEQVKKLEADLAKYEKETLASRFAAYLAAPNRKVSSWTIVSPKSSVSAGKAKFEPQADGSFLATGPNANFDTYTFTFSTNHEVAAIRLEALAHPSMVKNGPGRASNGNFALSDVKVTAAQGKGKPEAVKIASARATFEQRGLPVSATIDGDAKSAWAVDPEFGKNQAAVYEFAKPIGNKDGTTFTLTLKFNNNTGHNIGRPRISINTAGVTGSNLEVTAGDGLPEGIGALLASRGGKFDEKERELLLKWYRTQDEGWLKLDSQLRQLIAKGPSVAKFKAMICGEGLSAVRLHSQGGDHLEHTHFLNRGDPNQKDGIATQGFLQILSTPGESEKRWQQSPPTSSKTPWLRRSLANWIVDHERGAGHLLARVIANRLWVHHFGRGIVTTPSDFGLQGEKPSHPELLEWLAGELIRQEWRLKPLHRLLLTSAAYRRDTANDAAKTAIDPENKYLWRRVPKRLEAEIIRDSLLAVSGQLDRRMFGPGTLDAQQKRRSLYFFVKRSQLIPMLVLFDAPDGTVGVEQRTNTTIAPQALLMMNNPVVRSASDAFARRLATEKDLASSVKSGYRLALGREPKPQELADALAFVKEQRAGYAEDKIADAEQRAMVDLCQVLVGLNEFIYVD
jgi:cytochrome c553